MHFAMHAISNHVEVLNKVTPIDLPVQSAVLLSLTGWLSNMETIIGWRKAIGFVQVLNFRTDIIELPINLPVQSAALFCLCGRGLS